MAVMNRVKSAAQDADWVHVQVGFLSIARVEGFIATMGTLIKPAVLKNGWLE